MKRLTAEIVKQLLFDVIDDLSKQREKYLVNPKTSFTRSRKIDFSQTLIFPMIASSDNITTELLDYFECNGNAI